ncbi:hypothetical protein DUNSADRAFT_12251 [Dunaliella salina]|uniref:Encoded protein n=1 Tax=Dunaliella salina TaxID=3046 RepID=A0ABQ7GBM1_DUNSA|nr:hypothetical protein DUNSADRAFT_12251 [Dunaliella salina]|eukprot:KAF5832010.1 hypothetical protein DUNSADRAFT_12251 [Dunaliella salina]
MMGIKAQMGGLKRVNRGTVTAPRNFVAGHPDGGTMRVTVQGVSKSEGLGTKNRIETTLHPDTTFKVRKLHNCAANVGGKVLD